MVTRVATATASGTADEAVRGLIGGLRAQLEGALPVLVLAFASTDQPLAEILPQLARAFSGAVVLGASSAGEFTERGDVKRAVSAFALAGDFKVVAGMGEGLKGDPVGAVARAGGGLPSQVAGYPDRPGVLLLDPLSGNGEEVTLILGAETGDAETLVGGAAGDDLAMKSCVVGMGERVAGDALVYARIFSRTRLGLGVSHGHRPLSGPLRVTRAQGNVVFEVDGRPAWDVWRDKTRASAALRDVDVDAIAAVDEVAFLLRYEAGLASGSAFKIRAPLSRARDGSLSFACGMPEGTVFRITESVPEAQVSSARAAARGARAALGDRKVAGALVFD